MAKTTGKTMAKTTSTETKSKKKIYIGIGVLVLIAVIVLIVVLTGAASKKLCSTTVRNEVYNGVADTDFQGVNFTEVRDAADKVGVPVQGNGTFSSSVNSEELVKVLKEVIKNQPDGVFGIAASTTSFHILVFGKIGGPYELIKLPSDAVTVTFGGQEITGANFNGAVLKPAGSYSCPTEPTQVAGGTAPPAFQVPEPDGTASPAPA